MALDTREARLVRLFAAAVLGRFDLVRAVRLSAPAGEPDRAWREAVLQVHIFAGFPRQVETYAALDAAGGLGELGADESEMALPADAARERGRVLFERIYRDEAQPVRALLARHHPDCAGWIEEHAYGRILARPGITARQRELLAIAALAALGQERQLASHVRGALRCGADRHDVDKAIAGVADLVTEDHLDRVRAVVARFALDETP